MAAPIPRVPDGTAELGLDIIRVERIGDAIARFGDRFIRRVLTPGEAAYVRGRPETFAGRWAAKEAVSKVLGLGVRGIGWLDIEIERLPTGEPARRRAPRRRERRLPAAGAARPRPQGNVRQAARRGGVTRLRGCSPPGVPGGGPGRRGARHARRARVTPAALCGEGRRGDNARARRGR